MSVKATFPTPRPARVQYVAWAAAFMLVVMAVTQLFSFEDYPTVLSAVLPINDQSLIFIASAKIVIVEVFALPFLLGMRLSKLMRAISALLGVAISLFWFFITLTNAHTSNSGLLGDTVSLPGGIVAVLWSSLLLGSIGYVLYWTVRERQSTS